jgi:uncharacterized membrane protein YgdD (TMEM256/DUF423 family)
MGWHAFALLLAGILAEVVSPGLINTAGVLFLTGIVLFSGSLVVLALDGPRWVAMLTPLGGVAFIAGWITTAIALNRMFAAGRAG